MEYKYIYGDIMCILVEFIENDEDLLNFRFVCRITNTYIEQNSELWNKRLLKMTDQFFTLNYIKSTSYLNKDDKGYHISYYKKYKYDKQLHLFWLFNNKLGDFNNNHGKLSSTIIEDLNSLTRDNGIKKLDKYEKRIKSGIPPALIKIFNFSTAKTAAQIIALPITLPLFFINLYIYGLD